MPELHRHLVRPGQSARSAMILLPAAQSSAADLEREGFVAAVRQRELDIDLLLPEFSPDSVTDGTALQQLHNDVVLPLLADNYDTLWMMGISIGGYLAIAYEDRYPHQLDGLCLLAPYPGSRLVWGEVAASGGVESWQPGEVSEDDHERRVWRWLKQRYQKSLKVHLGYGQEDRFAKGQALMAAALHKDTIDTLPGEHHWPVWLVLWEHFLNHHTVAFAPIGKAEHI